MRSRRDRPVNVLMLAAAITPLGLVACTTASSKTAIQAVAEPPPMRVEIAEARIGVLHDEWVFLGEVHSVLRAQLGAGADGVVQSITVRLGDRVTEGQWLVRIDPSLARARVAAAEASRTETTEELAQASRDRGRAERLGAAVLSEAEIEQNVMRTQTLQARAERLDAAQREARVQLDRHRVAAPFTGVVATRHVDPGDWVSLGQPLLELVDDQQVEVIVPVSADLVGRIEVHDPVELRIHDHEVSGKVVGIVRALDPVTRTAPLRVVPDVVDPWLFPGISVDVAFAVDRTEPGVIVPRDAIVHGAVGTRVVKIVDAKAMHVLVRVIASADHESLVQGEGLAEGDRVVIRGNERLQPGQAVEIAVAEPVTKTAAAEPTIRPGEG